MRGNAAERVKQKLEAFSASLVEDEKVILSTILQLATQAIEMEELQISYNLQYLQLQNQMQNENRQFTMVSNIMKTKHDTVKNSISNIR
jgi:hypothetical protein